MRREEAEAEAAWRNEQDERRGRLEFYAFDPSAGLADDAWEVSMRLRSGPAERPAAPAPEPAYPEPEVPAPVYPDRWVPEPAEPYLPAEPAEAAEPYLPGATAEEYAAPERRRPAPRRRLRRPRRRVGEQVDEAAVEPRTPLGRAVRVVGGAVIVVALLWVGATTALLVMVGGTSPTGLALYAAALLAGLIAIALGAAIRRS